MAEMTATSTVEPCADCGQPSDHCASLGRWPALCQGCWDEMMRAWTLTFPNGFTPAYLRIEPREIETEEPL